MLTRSICYCQITPWVAVHYTRLNFFVAATIFVYSER